jgi:hypothetical protein
MPLVSRLWGRPPAVVVGDGPVGDGWGGGAWKDGYEACWGVLEAG